MKTQIPLEAFNVVYQELYQQLFRYSNKIVKNTHHAEEIVQDAFLRLFKEDYNKIEDHLRAWMYTVCYTQSLKSISKNNRYVELFETDRIDEDRDPSENLQFSETKKMLAKHMKSLTKKQRDVIKCRFFKDLSYEQTAKKMNTKSGNVGFIQNKTLKKLRELFETEPHK